MEELDVQERLLGAVCECIEHHDWPALRALLVEEHATDILDLLYDLEKPDRVLVFRLLPKHLAGEVFGHLEPEYQTNLLMELSDEESRPLLASLRPDDRTSLLEELPGRATQRLLNLLSYEDLVEARSLLGYPEESVGRLMTPDYIAVRADWTLSRALDHIRLHSSGSETINIIYIIDDAWKLIDAVELQKFILASPTSRVQEIMDNEFVSITAIEDREEAVLIMQRYDLFALPVVDSEGVLLGIVTVDDVLDVAQEEATEDFHKTGGVAPLRMSYRQSSVLSLYQKRIGWLLILVLLNLISASIIAAYQDTLSSAIALAFFIPLLIGSGGNAGAQAATLVIRALATEDITLGQWFRTLTKELLVGLTLGLTMGAACSLLGVWRGGMELALIVGASMAAIILVANITGMVLPFLLIRFGMDPAVASNPLITTITDSTGLIIYFTVATSVLSSL